MIQSTMLKRCYCHRTSSLRQQQSSNNDSTLLLLYCQYGHLKNVITLVMSLLVTIIVQQKMILSFPTDRLSMSTMHPYLYERNSNITINELCIHSIFPTLDRRRRNTNIRSIHVPCVYRNYIPNDNSLLTLSSFDFYQATTYQRNVTKQSMQQHKNVVFTLLYKYFTDDNNQPFLSLENEITVQDKHQKLNEKNSCPQQNKKRKVDTIVTTLRGGSITATVNSDESDSDDGSENEEIDNDAYIDKLIENVSDDDDDDDDDDTADDDVMEKMASANSLTVKSNVINTSPVANVIVPSQRTSSSSSSKSISSCSTTTKRSNNGSSKSSDTSKLPTGSSMSSKEISSIKSKNSSTKAKTKRSSSSKAEKNTKTTTKVKNRSTIKTKKISKKSVNTKNTNTNKNTTNNAITFNNINGERDDAGKQQQQQQQQQSSDEALTKMYERGSDRSQSQSQSTHFSSIQQHEHEQQVLPNAIYRFLLKRGGNIGRTLVLTLIMCTEWIQLYIPMIGSMGKTFMTRFFPPLKQPKRKQQQQQQRDTSRKKQSKRADTIAINQLQQLGIVQIEKYKQLSQKFIKRYGFGSTKSSSDDNNEHYDDTITNNKNKTKTSADVKSSESLFDKIATIATMPLKSSSSSGQTTTQQMLEEEVDDDIEWVLKSLSRPSSLNNKKGSKVVIPHTINEALTRLIVSHRRKEYNVVKDTSGLDSMNAFATDVGRFITNDIIGTSLDEKNNKNKNNNNDDSFVSRSIRAATGTSASGLSRILLGAYPRDAVPPNEAGNADGIYSIAYKYGWGEWTSSDNEDDDNDNDNDDYSFDNINDDNNDDDDNYYTYGKSNNHYKRHADSNSNNNNENSKNDRYNTRRPKGTVDTTKYHKQLPQVSIQNTVKKRRKVKKVKKIVKLDYDTTPNRLPIGREKDGYINTKHMTALDKKDGGQERRKKKVKKKSKGIFDILKDNVQVSFGDTTSKVQVGFSFGTSSSTSLSSHNISPGDNFSRRPTESTTRSTRTEPLSKRSPIFDRQRMSTSTSSLSKEYDERKHNVAKQLKSRSVSRHRSILDDDID